MAKATLKTNADIREVRRDLKRKGYILRAYKQPDGTYRYSIRKNTYTHGTGK